MLGRRHLVALLTVISLIFAGLGTVALASESDEQSFLNKINAERTSRGLNPLTVDSALRAHARGQTQFMIDGGCSPKSICHSSNLGSATTGWSALGENVGRGGTVDSLHAAFMDSKGHRDNILDPRWNYVGIGAKFNDADGRLYVTVVFMKKGEGGGNNATTTTKPKSTTTTVKSENPPKPNNPTTTTTAPTTTTTLPPTTTTTLIVGPDKAITPGSSCVLVTRFGWLCQD